MLNSLPHSQGGGEHFLLIAGIEMATAADDEYGNQNEPEATKRR
jgi:hypothetical protein